MTDAGGLSQNDVPPPLPAPVPYPGSEHVDTTPKQKATKAQVGTVLAALTTGLTAAATQLPDPWNGYVTGAVAIIGIVATFFGIYLPVNKGKY